MKEIDPVVKPPPIAAGEWKSISSEVVRRYSFPASEVVIMCPIWLCVSKSGGHRIIDDKGDGHYIPTGCVPIRVRTYAGCNNPVFSF